MPKLHFSLGCKHLHHTSESQSNKLYEIKQNETKACCHSTFISDFLHRSLVSKICYIF